MTISQESPIEKRPAVEQAANLLGWIQFRLHATRFVQGVICVALLIFAGCGSAKPPFQQVAGRVTFQKEALRKGLIEFVPTVSGGSRAGAIVRDGQYTVRREAGLLPGNYRVTIVSNVPRMADWEETDANGAAARPQNIQISEKYNVNTVLTAEVKSDGKQTLDFDLE